MMPQIKRIVRAKRMHLQRQGKQVLIAMIAGNVEARFPARNGLGRPC